MSVCVRRRSLPLRPFDVKRATTKALAFVTHLPDSTLYYRHRLVGLVKKQRTDYDTVRVKLLWSPLGGGVHIQRLRTDYMRLSSTY